MALESAWEKWNEEECSDEELTAALNELFEWVDQMARNKPKHDFWAGIF